MKWFGIAMLAFGMAWFAIPDAQQGAANRTLSLPATLAPSAIPPESGIESGSKRAAQVKALTGSGGAPAKETISAQTCEVIPVEGAHAATDVEEARAGAAEDVRDVCPSNMVSHILENCVEHMIQNTEGVLERQYRCLQKGNCRICGDDLARRNEILR